jgi:hypothetical protein
LRGKRWDVGSLFVIVKFLERYEMDAAPAMGLYFDRINSALGAITIDTFACHKYNLAFLTI